MVEANSKDFTEIQAQWATVRGRIRQKIGDAQVLSATVIILLVAWKLYWLINLIPLLYIAQQKPPISPITQPPNVINS